jgi:hypothetical protein
MNIEHERNNQTDELGDAELALVTGGFPGAAGMAMNVGGPPQTNGSLAGGGGGGQLYIPFVGYITPK